MYKRQDKQYALNLIIIWVGNLIGAVSIGLLTKFTRIAKMTIGNVTFAEKAANLCSIKLSDNLLSIFILAVFCNIMIFIAVESYNKNPHEIGKMCIRDRYEGLPELFRQGNLPFFLLK